WAWRLRIRRRRLLGRLLRLVRVFLCRLLFRVGCCFLLCSLFVPHGNSSPSSSSQRFAAQSPRANAYQPTATAGGTPFKSVIVTQRGDRAYLSRRPRSSPPAPRAHRPPGRDRPGRRTRRPPCREARGPSPRSRRPSAPAPAFAGSLPGHGGPRCFP